MDLWNVHIKFQMPPVNRIARAFVLGDLIFWGGWGLVGPIFALFVLDRIAGATALTVGAAVGIYWAARALVQLPVAIYIDKHDGERDDFHTLIAGLILGGFSALAYLTVSTPGWLFLVSLLHGVAFGLYSPSWFAIFSRHLDKGAGAFDWALDGTGIAVVSGITAFLGGAIAGIFGFSALYVIASVLSFAAAFLLLSVPRILFPEPTSPPLVPGSKPPHSPK
jgi:MFS family permease